MEERSKLFLTEVSKQHYRNFKSLVILGGLLRKLEGIERETFDLTVPSSIDIETISRFADVLRLGLSTSGEHEGINFWYLASNALHVIVAQHPEFPEATTIEGFVPGTNKSGVKVENPSAITFLYRNLGEIELTGKTTEGDRRVSRIRADGFMEWM